ncbi:hypothetical protein Tco_0853184 [Tanacetum coccineum]
MRLHAPLHHPPPSLPSSTATTTQPTPPPPQREPPSHQDKGAFGWLLSTNRCVWLLNQPHGCVRLKTRPTKGASGFSEGPKRVRWDGWQPPEKGVLFVVVPGSAAGVFVFGL